MKRFLILFLIFVAIFSFSAFAEEAQYDDGFRNSVSTEDSLLSDETDLNNPQDVQEDISYKNIFGYLKRQLSIGVKSGLQLLIKGIALILLSVILNRCAGNVQNQNLQLLFSFILSVSLMLMCEHELRDCAGQLREAIQSIHVFTSACIPAFGVVMVAAGEGGGAAVFSGAMVLLGEISSLLGEYILLPLTDVYLAIGLCSAVSDEYNFASIGKNIRRFIIWVIGIGISLFRVVLRMQSGAASAGDQLTKKYIRSAVGSLIPMVGNTLSQGVDGLFAVAAGVKTSFAIGGVLILLSVMLPSLIRIGVCGLIWSFCKWVADFMNDSGVRPIADVLANCFYLMLALGGSVVLMGLFSFFGLMIQVGL